MKKIVLLAGLFLSILNVCYAKEPKVLDPKTITAPVPITQISFMINQSTDTDNKGKDFLRQVFSENMEKIVSQVKEQNGIVLDPSAFMNQFSENTLDIQMKKIELGDSFKVNQYIWSNENDSADKATLILAFAVQENGTMPLTVAIHEDDPKYKPGKSLSIQLSMAAVEVSTKENK